jgi:DNA-binding PadR family transcriptional regulator
METRYSIGMSNRKPSKTDVLQGTLDLMVLQTLVTLGPLHGYAIATRLEQRGLVSAEWGVTDKNRKARFYNITGAGRRQLTTEKAEWDRMVSIMHMLLREQV